MSKTEPRPTTKAGSRRASRIPRFHSVDEAAAFWQTHSVADYQDELEIVPNVKFVRAQPKKAITVRLSEEVLAALTELAQEQGVGPSTLARMLIAESLRARQRRASTH